MIYKAITILGLLLLTCAPFRSTTTYVTATIPVVEERLALSPLISEANIEALPGWPPDPALQKILLENFSDIWNRLYAEFRRCEKYGLYMMVADNDNPTIRISVAIISADIVNDSLYLPVRLLVERLRDDQRFIYTLPAGAPVKHAEKLQSSSFHTYGLLLANYRRFFPYRLIVSFFYEHKLE